MGFQSCSHPPFMTFEFGRFSPYINKAPQLTEGFGGISKYISTISLSLSLPRVHVVRGPGRCELHPHMALRCRVLPLQRVLGFYEPRLRSYWNGYRASHDLTNVLAK